MERLTKQHFRLKYKNLRSSLSNEQFNYDCKQINKHINTIATGNVHLFLPIKEKNEVNIWPTIKQLQNSNEVLGTSIFDSATDHVNHVEILKTANFITGELKTAMTGSLIGKISSFLNISNLRKFKKRLDPRLYNGAIFIGLDSPVVKSHGGTDYIGFSNSLDVCHRIVRGNLIEKIKQNI